MFMKGQRLWLAWAWPTHGGHYLEFRHLRMENRSFSHSDKDVELVDALCESFSRCSHRQQVQLMEDRLPQFLKRDFLTLLPPEIVVKILGYLETGAVFNCLLVSRNWNSVITSCQAFWKHHACLLGISPNIMSLKINKHISYKTMTVAVLRARNAIMHAKPIFLQYPDKTGKPPKATLTCRPAKPICNGLFISHEVYACSDVGTYMLSIRAIDHMDNLVELTAVTVSHLFVIIWSQSSSKHVLIHGSDGSWIQTRILSREGFDLLTTTWNGSVYSGAYYELGCCAECCLVGIVNKVVRDKKLWDLLVNRFIVGNERPDKLSTTFTFLPFNSDHNNVFFQIHKLVVISDSIEHDREGFCTRHKLLFQFGACICIFSLDIVREENGKQTLIVQNLSNLCPFNDHSYYSTPSILGHEFCLSSNDKLAAYFVDGNFIAWNLDTLELYGLRRKMFPTNADCIAVGSLFSIMYTSGICGLRVLSTVNGESLLLHLIDYTGDNPVHGPRDQQWLNDLFVSEKSLSLAITLREWQNPGLLLFNIL